MLFDRNSTVIDSFFEQPTDKIIFSIENFDSVGAQHSVSLIFGSLAQFAEVNNNANIRHQIAVPSSLISSRSSRQNLATIVMPNLATNLPNRVDVFRTDLWRAFAISVVTLWLVIIRFINCYVLVIN